VHEPWIELTVKSNSWKPRYEDTYNEPHEGGKRGLSSKIVKIVQTPTSTLATLFFALFPIFNFQSNCEAYRYINEWVKPCSSLDRDGNPMKRKHFVVCNRTD